MRSVDFLLECIGFPPDYDIEELVERIRAEGEPAVWRGPADRHLRYDLGAGLELRLDRDTQGDHWHLFPQVQVPHRLRVAVERVRQLPDSPFDALLHGWADPPSSEYRDGPRPGAYRLSVLLTDARRLPHNLARGSVLAVSMAGFALDVLYVGPNSGVSDPRILEQPHGAAIGALGGIDDPGGCADVSVRIREIRHCVNPFTGMPVDMLVTDAPGRPLQLMVSRWQLEKDSLPLPRPGWRIEGTFLFSGRIAGGVPGPKRATGSSFG